ncbi:MAG: cupin domain-containing protein [Anaerolineae bacterium]
MNTNDTLSEQLDRLGARLRAGTEAEHVLIPEKAPFPNNDRLPALIYRQVVTLPDLDPAAVFEAIFRAHGWQGTWRNGIYGFHHYHSTAHEVLGVYQGHATVQLGGDQGITTQLTAGDVVVIPAGVAHKNLGSSVDFGVVGAYPSDQRWDMNYGRPDERPEADKNIAKVPTPSADPLYGDQGPLIEAWKP